MDEHTRPPSLRRAFTRLRRSLGPSPNIWRFTDIIAEKFAVTASRLEAQRRGSLPRRNRERHCIRADIQARNERALQRGVITLREFLDATSRLLDVGVGVVVDEADIPAVGEEVELAPEPGLLVPSRPPTPRRRVDLVHEVAEPVQDVAQARLQCGVFLDCMPSLVIIPCGHTTCAECHANLVQMVCPFCRTSTINVQRFFI